MFDGSMIDVAIGVLLIFVITSLATSAIVEAVGGLLHRRSKNLWDTLDLLLARTELDEGRLVDLIYRQPFVAGLVRPTSRVFFRPDGAHMDRAPARGAIVPGTDLTPAQRRRRFYGPQRIDARDFADSLIEVLRPGGMAETANEGLRDALAKLPDGDLKVQLTGAVGAAGDEMIAVRARIEEWYERHMSAVSLWYRRQTRWFLFATGLTLAVGLNVDALHTATVLYRNDEVRASLVSQAEAIAAAACAEEPTDDQLDCVRGHLDTSVELPLGWNERTDTSSTAWILRVLGWLVVAGSVTVGAPFWFDVLRRALRVRPDAADAAG